MKFINKVIEKTLDLNSYKIAYLISCFLYYLPFTNIILAKIFKIFIIWGLIIFLYNYFGNKKYTLKKIDYLLFVFLLISLIGCIVNYKFNFIANITSIAYLFIQMIIMLSYVQEKDINTKIKKIKILNYIIVILTFICAIVSLLIYFLNIKYAFSTDVQQLIFGVFEGRLWGAYGNPNTLGHFAIISIWTSIILIIINKFYKNGRNNYFLFLNIILEFICLVLSNSRSSLVGIFISVLVFSIFMIALNNKEKFESIWKAIINNKLITVLKSILVLLCLSFAIIFFKYSMVFSSYAFKNINLDFLPKINDNNSANNKNDDDIVSVNRDYVDSDVSNGRFELWQAGIKVFSKNPLFGVGPKNIKEYANKYLDAQTLIETPNLAENMHNIYLQVLVSHGIIAFIILMIYLSIVIVKNLITIFKLKKLNVENILVYKLITCNLAILCSLLAINLFDSNIMYFCSVFFTFAFWNTLSSINSLTDNLTDDKKKVLFLISNLGGGGAEKVLIDLTNNLNYTENEIEVKTLFNEGKYINELNKNIKYTTVIKKPTLLKKRVFSRIIKYFPRKFVYNMLIDKKYDVEIAFLESLPAKILSGSNSNALKLAWIHIDIFGLTDTLKLFKNKKNLVKSYQNFDRVVCVSDSVKDSFVKNTNLYQNTVTIYNPIDKKQILEKSKLKCDIKTKKDKFIISTIGRLTEQKAYLRLCEVINKLVKEYKNIELWILGEGPERRKIEKYIEDNKLKEYIKLLGFKDNPYSYIVKTDLFVSSSIAEGYSLVLAEAMVLGLPVLSTNTTGPDNLLEHGKYGCIVDNTFDGLYNGLKEIINNPERLKEIKEKVKKRQDFFKLEEKVLQVEELFKLKDKVKKDGELFCTVFTPSYNRAYILEKLYKSLQKQTCTDFEWVVVDDGSSDNTEELFVKWIKEKNKFKINYIKVQNGGKQRAINKGIDLAKGKMFFIVDSDDELTENAIEKLKYYENTISDYNNFAGISGLRGYNREKVIGERNKKEFIDATNLQRPKFKLTGDKAECYYLDLLKRYRFPEVFNEKFVTECVVWDKIAADNYKIRWFNEIIYLGDYLADGYTKKGNTLFQKNPNGYLIYIRNENSYYPLDIKRKLGNYYRYYEIVKEEKTKKEIADDLLISKVYLNIIIYINKLVNRLKGR